MGLLVWLLSVVLSIPLAPLGFLYGLITRPADSNRKFRRMAVGNDILGSVYMQELLNDLLLTKKSTFRFGQHGVTISAVLGHNILHRTLTPLGIRIAAMVDRVAAAFGDKDHCVMAFIIYLQASSKQ